MYIPKIDEENATPESNSRRKNRLIAQGIFSLVAIAALVASLALGYSRLELLQHGARAQATVTELVPGTSGRSRTALYPVLTFCTNDGKRITFKSSVPTNMKSRQAGDVVEVLYTAEKNDSRGWQTAINEPLELWFAPGFLGIFALGFGFIVAASFIAGGRTSIPLFRK